MMMMMINSKTKFVAGGYLYRRKRAAKQVAHDFVKN